MRDVNARDRFRSELKREREFGMSDDEDDYLANIDKFLVDPNTTSAPKTYSQIRKEAAKQSTLKNQQNRTKSRRQREVESRTEGLSKSLFERAKDEEDAGLVSGNKALSIMMKMGFKPGQALGATEDEGLRPLDAPETPPDDPIAGPSNPDLSANSKRLQHKVEPLPINEWAGWSLSCHLQCPLNKGHPSSFLYRKTGYRTRGKTCAFANIR